MQSAEVLTIKPRLRYRLSGKFNNFLAKRLGISRVTSMRAARALNKGLHPFGYSPRKQMAQVISATGDAELTIDPDEGYRFLKAGTLPEMANAVSQAKEVYEQAEADGKLETYKGGTSRKKFLVYATSGPQSAQYLDLMRLALSRPILDAVANYLGSVPVLSYVNIMVSLPNDSEVGSQLYHLDFADESQIKLFVNVDAVTQHTGPFTFVPATSSEDLIKQFNYDRGRLSIEEVTDAVGSDGQLRSTGPAGNALLVDTSKCLHYGSNKNETTRVVLVIQYTDYYAPEASPTNWPVDQIARELDLDDVQRMALQT